MRKMIAVSICLGILGALSTSQAADTDAILSQLKKKSAAVKSYKCRIITTTEFYGKPLKTTVALLYKKPDKFRSERLLPNAAGKLSTISDGKTLWTCSLPGNFVSKIDIARFKEKSGGSAPRSTVQDMSSPWQFGKEGSYKHLGEEKVGEVKCLVFECLHPRAGKAGASKIKIWVGEADGFTRKSVTYRQDGKEAATLICDQIELNLDVADSEFQFKPPADARVTDMTDRRAGQVKPQTKK